MSLVPLGLQLVVALTAASQVTTTVTLYDVTRTKEAESPGVSRSWSRGLQPVGTASDRSRTTFSEKIVEYEMTVSKGATSTFSTTSWEALRIQSASGYARIQTGSTFSSVQSCSYVSGGGGCMEIINGLSHVQSSSGHSTTPQETVFTATTQILLASEATVTPVQTLTVIDPAASSTISSTPTPTPTPSQIIIPPLASMSRKSNVLKPALIGSLVGALGLILLVLGLFLVCRRQRRNTKGQKEDLSRELVGSDGLGDINQHQYHYQSSQIPSMIESSKDGVSIDSSHFPNSPHYTRSLPHSPTHLFSAPVLPFKPQAPPSRLGLATPLSAEQPEVESLAPLESTRDTLTSQATAVASTSASRQNTTDSTPSSHPYTHPGHGFKIHPSRFIERLSSSSSYMESLTAGGNPETVYQEPNEMDPDNPLHPHQHHDQEQEDGQPFTSLPEATTSTHLDPDSDHESTQSSFLRPPSSTPRDSQIFATPSQTPNSHSSSSLPISRSNPHIPYAHFHIPTTSTFPPPSTPRRSWVTPSPFSHQSFQTAEEGNSDDDTDTSTVENLRTRSRSHSPPASSADHGGMEYGYAV